MKASTIIIWSIFCGAFATNAQGQFNTKKADSTNIYSYSLRKILGADYGKEKIYLEESSFIFPLFKNAFDTSKVLFVNTDQIRKLKNGTVIHTMVPIELDMENSVYVTLIFFEVRHKRKIFKLLNKGGAKAVFKYDCDKHRFEYDHIDVVAP